MSYDSGLIKAVTPGIGNTLSSWDDVIKDNKETGIDPEYRWRARWVRLITALGTPLAAFERWRLARKVQATTLPKSPIFILGHWRSGTTFLHNLFAQDERMGYVTNLHGLFPNSFIANPIYKYFTRWIMPNRRPMDAVRLDVYSPQEEELALSNMGETSFYHAFHFPQNIRSIFHQYVMMEASPRKLQKWKRTYIRMLKKAAYFQDEKRMVLKNPPNTARIPMLLSLFPDAKFIHIYRNPANVFASTEKLYQKVLPVFQLQDFDEQQLRQDIIYIYKQMMTKYEKDKQLVPAGNLMEISYDEFVQQPIEGMQELYDFVELDAFDGVQPNLQTYLDGRGQYKQQPYQLPEELEAQLQKEWAPWWQRYS